MAQQPPAVRTVHLVLPATGRSLCGHEEVPTGPDDARAVPCPECCAMLRSGLLPQRPPPGAGWAAGRGLRRHR